MLAPQRIRLEGSRVLKVTWADGTALNATADALRSACPCARCRDQRGIPHVALSPVSPGAKRSLTILPGGGEAMTITAVEPVGNYAVRLIFSDGHATGIFSWDTLRTLAVAD